MRIQGFSFTDQELRLMAEAIRREISELAEFDYDDAPAEIAALERALEEVTS